MYKWYTVNTGKLCPAGWHVPSDADWNTLTNYLINNGYGFQGSGDDIAKSMAAKTDWTSWEYTGAVGNNLAANNKSGFTGLPISCRFWNGEFEKIGSHGYWWSSTYTTEFSNNFGHIWGLSYLSGILSKNTLPPLGNGCSVRCIKDN